MTAQGALFTNSSTPLWFARLRLDLQRLAKPVLQKKQNGLFSIVLQVPLPDSLLLPTIDVKKFYWHQPAGNLKLIGIGEAECLLAKGEDRFHQLQRHYTRLQENWTCINHGKTNASARAFLGYAFDPKQKDVSLWKGFANSQLSVPSLLLEWCNGQCNLTFSTMQGQKRDPDQVIAGWLTFLQKLMEQTDRGAVALNEEQPRVVRQTPAQEEWIEQVKKIKRGIVEDELSKVVLSRQLTLECPGKDQRNVLLEELTGRYPGCTLLAMETEGGTLLAATPEKLVSSRAGKVESDALAGTLASSDRESHLAMQHYEHAPVVSAINSALMPLCLNISSAKRPTAMQLGPMQHMWTQIEGRLKPDISLFELIDALHPTPAVGGVPRKKAMEWIVNYDQTPRGWYTGGFGWLGDNSEGEISVVLRCALLQENRAHLFAGAGITEVSDPEQEFRETEWKMSAVLEALHSRQMVNPRNRS